MCFKHHGEHDAVEHDVVFADEVHQTRFGVFPPLLPRVGQQLFGIRYVTDGRIKPHVEHFALCPFDGNGNAPIQVACHGSWLQV